MSTVSSHPTSEYRRGKAEAASSRNGTIQIWSLQTSDPHDFGRSTENKLSNEARHGSSHPRLDLCLLLTDEVYQLKWCPRGGDSEDVLDEDEDQGMQEDGKEGPIKPKRLGILAALHTDWSLVLYEIPRPEDARAQHSSPEEQTLHRMFPCAILLPDLDTSAKTWTCDSTSQSPSSSSRPRRHSHPMLRLGKPHNHLRRLHKRLRRSVPHRRRSAEPCIFSWSDALLPDARSTHTRHLHDTRTWARRPREADTGQRSAEVGDELAGRLNKDGGSGGPGLLD